MRHSMFTRVKLPLVGTIILSLILFFVVATSLAPPLMAGDCAIGGCDCGSCGSDCKTKSLRIDFFGVDIVLYECLCPGTAFCQGQAH